MYASSLLLLVSAALAAAQGGPVKPCTTTVRAPAHCGCDMPKATITNTVDCHGCAAITTAPGIACDIACLSSTTGTRTVTKDVCKPTPHPERRDEEAGKPAKCTTTSTVRPTCGCEKAQHTVTKNVDCHGCDAIATEVARGPVCRIKCSNPEAIKAGSTTTVAVCKPTPA